MALTAGTRIGPYEIVEALGAGGMGEVYRARDTKLDRDVAIKVLPAQFVADPERVARFQREAKTLAALNHPHIGGIYGLEDADGVHALVLELVEGPTLADRILQGPIPLDEALPIARQIAEALEAAHEAGIIHRDLKPANIKLRPDGTVKVLDFGLAKALEPMSAASANVTASPTITTPAMMTGIGTILGTAAYMSPEQAKGRPADKRSDVWAFGCVLFEMLTGGRAFAGDDISDTLASILKSDPDWPALPPDTPPHIRSLARRCLTKDRSARMSAMAVVRFLLDEPARSQPETDQTTTARRAGMVWPVAVALLSIVTVALLALVYRARTTPSGVSRLYILPPEKTMFATNRRNVTSGVISPDGRTIAFTARDSADRVLLWLRPIDSLTAALVAGTEDAAYPFWSPDSRFIGYTATGKLFKVDAHGGAPQVICTCMDVLGYGTGAWNDDGIVVFSAGPGALQRVSSAGGTPSPLTRMAAGQLRHTAPSFLPDGDHVLYFSTAQSDDLAGVYVASLETGVSKHVVEASTGARYDPSSGQLLFGRNGILFAQPFNLKTLAISGEAVQVTDRLESSVRGFTSFSLAATGTLVYGVGGAGDEGLQLAVLDRRGTQIGTTGPVGNYRGIELSPDGKQLAVHRHDGAGGDIWIVDVTRGTSIRLTSEPAEDNSSPIWSPDGRYVIFASRRNNKWGIYRRSADGAPSDEQLHEFASIVQPMGSSPDGRRILYYTDGGLTRADLDVLTVGDSSQSTPLFHTRFLEPHGEISPDGKWIAYSSDEAGQMDLYVQAFPTPAGRRRISTGGGSYPRWRRDGSELYYMDRQSGGGFWAVRVKADGSSFETGTPERLFDSGYVNVPHNAPYKPYVAMDDGQRFVMQRSVSVKADQSGPLVVVLNWAEALRRK